ncbi:MAG TPA: hypothetical protein VK861_11775, partial [Bacteroidales bacterium]|nr:hypothetical protein [Bacteroidales bacterium]
MSSLSKKRVIDPVLTNLARGYTNTQYVSSSLFPIVNVAKEGGKIPLFTKESFKIYNTERAIRARSNRINPEDRDDIDFVLTEHDLEYPVDYRESQEDIFPTEAHATFVVTEGIMLRREKLAADLAQDDANYPAGSKITLAAGEQFTNTSSDPFTIFKNASEAVRLKIAKRPNTCLMGASSYAALRNHPAILERIKYTQRGIVTPDLLKALFDFETFVVGDSVYASDDGVLSDVWSDNVILAYIPPAKTDVARSVYEPSFGYTLRKKNNPVVDKYSEQGKVQIIRSTDLFLTKIVGSDAGYIIKDTNA